MNKAISVTAVAEVPLQTAWEVYTGPQHITQWNHASDDWHCPNAINDLRVGGRFSFTMAAKDGSYSFEFEGVYTRVESLELLAYNFGGRQAEVVFEPVTPGKTKVTVAFDLEDTNPEELQRSGWQAILENYKKYAESLVGQA